MSHPPRAPLDRPAAAGVRARGGRRPQRGLGILAVLMALMMIGSLGVLYINRGTLFEQRTAANLAQSTLALEVAEAGIEWATGMINSPFDFSTSCAPLSTANRSFRKRYLQTRAGASSSPTTDVVSATNVFPGCSISAGTLRCSCPDVPSGSATAVASLGSGGDPNFTVAFQDVAGDPEAVLLTVYACTEPTTACTSTSFASAGANARLSVQLKLRPVLRALPAAPLTAGTSVAISGSYNISNLDVATNGILVNAGTSISMPNGTSMSSLPGQPVDNAAVGNDDSLAALASADPTCSNSQMFSAYFGSTLSQYRAAPTTKTISCGSASDCRTQLATRYDEGWRSFYFATDLQLSGNLSFGSQADPIMLATPNGITINGNVTLYGLVFSNSADWNDLGTGSATVHGAQVSCAAYRNNGNGTLNYDATTLQNNRRSVGSMVRVPGSWRDFRTQTDTLP